MSSWREQSVGVGVSRCPSDHENPSEPVRVPLSVAVPLKIEVAPGATVRDVTDRIKWAIPRFKRSSK